MLDRQFANLLIEAVLKRMGDKYSKPEAIELVHRTGLAETGYRVTRQLGNGPARSYWQIEPATAKDILGRYLLKGNKKDIRLAVEAIIQRDVEKLANSDSLPEVMEHIDALGIILCRLKYWPKPGSIPFTLEGQAKYWKEHYNTPKGKGTVEHFIKESKELNHA